MNQISFQMQNCSFELKGKILVAKLTTEKWSICVLCIVFLSFKSAMHYYMYREIFSQLNRGKQASRHKYLQRKYTMCYCRICYKVHIRRGPKGFDHPQPPTSVTYSKKFKIVYRIKVIVDTQELYFFRVEHIVTKLFTYTDKKFFADSY